MYTVVNCQTGEVTTREQTAEEIAQKEAWTRDVLPGILLDNLRDRS